MIVFNKAARTGQELDYIREAVESGQLGGDGMFTKRCAQWFRDHTHTHTPLLTPSCTHALEMAAFLIDTQPGDEIIMPSYTFVSTANAFVLRGAKIVFVDVEPETMNMDATAIEAAITPKTKAIAPVHYAGVSCDMDTIMGLAKTHKLYVIEDAAQGLMSQYKGRPLGTIGDFGALSFHTTKNFTSGGEGGLLYVNNPEFAARAEVFREKGTNRSAFFRGEVDKYTWRDIGSSMLPSELQMAYLWAQLEGIETLHQKRLSIWSRYYHGLKDLPVRTSTPPQSPDIQHNGHIFFILAPDDNQPYLQALKERGIHATSHYEPLHSSSMGLEHGRVSGSMSVTETQAGRLIRLPLHVSMTDENVDFVISVMSDLLTT